MILRTIPHVFFTLSFVIVLLTDGGVYPMSLAAAVICMALAMISAGLRRGLHEDTARLFVVVLVAWVAVVAWTLLQAIPLSFGLAANPAWRGLGDMGIPASARISVVPGDTIAAILPISLPFMTILASLLLFRSDKQIEVALKAFGIAGAALAIFAIIQTVLFPGTLMFGPREAYYGNLTAPFVNRNTAATFYGLIALALLACFGLAVSDRQDGNRRQPSILQRPWFYLLLAVAAFLAVAMTRSRAGGGASLVAAAILLFGLISHFGTQKMSLAARVAGGDVPLGRKVAIIAGGLVLSAIVILLFFSRTLFRSELTAGDDGRLCIYPSIIAALRDNIYIGIGPGSFPYYFPAYRDPVCGVDFSWFMAHNFFLDAAIALGVVFCVCLMIASLTAFWWVYKTGLERRRSKKPLVWAGISSVALVIIHSIPDFSLQIPGFSMAFSLFFGLSAAISLNSIRRRVPRNK